ncbi:MAG: S-methyl-5'-thioadenosine phosphorylase [Actinomycetota bacterium]
MTSLSAKLAIIGGSGLYNLPELSKQRWERVKSPFGEPSDDFLFGELSGVPVVFVPRHGRGHVLSPSDINYRANIDGLKRCGVEDIISVSAVGSLDGSLEPGMFVLVTQYIDRTIHRESSFFGNGCVAHVSLAHPITEQMLPYLQDAARKTNLRCHLGGTYLAMEGPQFSSFAESQMYRSWGCQVIGMTNMPEAKLAREAEMCYSSVCMVTDYDCWHPGHASVSVADVVKVMHENSRNAQQLVAHAVPLIANARDRSSWLGRRALDNAIITAPEARSEELMKQLDAVAGRVLRK